MKQLTSMSYIYYIYSGMIQMSGGNVEMDYDQEKMYFRGHCLEHDVYDIFQLLIDAALEPRSQIAANVGIYIYIYIYIIVLDRTSEERENPQT